MEKGHFRADANVSIRVKGETILNEKTEIKNVNSIESVRAAVEKEIQRQIKEVEAGNEITAWTLDWDEDTQTLSKMRSKETMADYRYFKDPDLLVVHLDDAWLDEIFKKYNDYLPLPIDRRKNFITEFELPEYDADILTYTRDRADYFVSSSDFYDGDAKRLSNWMMNDVIRLQNDLEIEFNELSNTLKPEYLAEIIKLVDANTVNTPTGKSLLEKVQASGKSPAEIVEAEGLAQVSDSGAIREIAERIVAENPDSVEKYKSGKDSLIGWFVGQVMRESRGKADPNLAREVLEELLK